MTLKRGEILIHRKTVVLTLLATVTSGMDPGRYLYDVVVTSAGGTKTRVIEGIVTINAGIT